MAAADASDAAPAIGTTSPSAMTVNLAKNIVGSGVLALAAGVARFSGARTAIVPALAVLTFLAGVSGYSFALIARLSDAVGASTYRDIWARIFGTRSAFLPAATVTFKTGTGALGFAIIIGDSLASIATLCGAPKALCLPNPWIILISTAVLFPLCLLRDLSSLSIGSYLGTAGTLFTAAFMWTRLLDGSYTPGGCFYPLIPLASRPAFSPEMVLSPSIFVLVSMLATTFLAHFNAPKMYRELQSPADGSSKVFSFTRVVAGAFGLAALMCSAIMSAGFLTFGSSAQGLILNNYATSDQLAFIARIGISLSIIFSYPLNFSGLREGVLGLVGLSSKSGRADVHVIATLLIMLIVNGAALHIKNLGFVVSFGGAVLGSALVYIFPALMGLVHSLKQAAAHKRSNKTVPFSTKLDGLLAGALAALGTFLAVVGAVMSLKNR